MERLTFDGLFCDIAMCSGTPGGSFCEEGACSQRRVWERLKAYEDTGLEPEYITELLAAAKSMADLLKYHERLEETGRLVILPCKVGDTVYKLCPVSAFLKKGDLWSGRVIKRDCDMCSWGACDCHDIGPQYDDSHKNIVHEMKVGSLSKLVRVIPYWGKFYFSTREEAEAALKRGEQE